MDQVKLTAEKIELGRAEAKRILENTNQSAKDGKAGFCYLAGVSAGHEILVQSLAQETLPTLLEAMSVAIHKFADGSFLAWNSYTTKFVDGGAAKVTPPANTERDFILGLTMIIGRVQEVTKTKVRVCPCQK